MKKAVNCYLQAFARNDVEPVIFIICVEKINPDVLLNMKESAVSGVFTYFSQPWAEKCYVLSKESIKDNLTIPLAPMVALGAFFTSSSPSLSNHPFKDDPTIQYLYTSSFFRQQVETINEATPSKLIDLQLMEYNRLKTLASSLQQPELEEAVNDARSRTLIMKRKFEETFTSPAPAPPTSKVYKNNDRCPSLYVVTVLVEFNHLYQR